MNPSDIRWPFINSTESQMVTSASNPELSSSTRSRSYISCRTSTGIPRNSSVSLNSESITIFADVDDLPSRQGSRHREFQDPAVNDNDHRFDAKAKRHNIEPSESICSFNFDQSLSVPLQALVDTHRLVDNIDVIWQEKYSEASWSEPTKSGRAKTNSLYTLFPRPPSRALLHFARVFPKPLMRTQTTHADKLLPPLPYHVFDSKKKKQLVYLVGLGGMLSPLSSFIYFPALGAISRELHISSELVLLTITVHMVVQGLAPFISMPFCDYYGRRPTFIATLTVFVGANAGLIFSKTFVDFMLLRAVQAFGSAYLATTGSAVIGDISTGKERASLTGLFGSILMFSHFISPVLGGVFTQYFGFPSIFWFQLVLGTIILGLIVFALPETLRSIVGNGTIRTKGFQQPLFSIFKTSTGAPFDTDHRTTALKPTIKNIIEPLSFLLEINILASILFGSIAFATSTTVISTTALLLQSRYYISTLIVGVAFLPSGAGSVLSFILLSYLMGRDQGIIETQDKTHHDIKEENTALNFQLISEFHIAPTRLRSIWWITLLLFIGVTAGYGFSLNSKQIALPLILQFFIACSATGVLLLNGVLIADSRPGNSAAGTTVVNLVRFGVGALAIGVVQLLFDRIGTGFTFLIFAMATLALTLILALQWGLMIRWRSRSENTKGTAFENPFVGENAFWKRLPAWTDIWETLGLNGLSFEENTSWQRLREWEEIGGRSFKDLYLVMRNFWRRIPGGGMEFGVRHP